ncbi:T9SS type A sorting domain-containing protein [uncultured Algibacter sp.]|uniref:T9SS type A sorting domain-containing protein n=1 Tax=uncultured Algibacter sp. TaxID=298659 RepID=UPI00262BF16F|nr:T9SS type A sorting domain-containing protein [uncultured Algibacter sp.]
MKRIILFTMCFAFAFTNLNAQDYNQVIFTGEGGSDAWEDPENWRRGGDPTLPGVPESGDDILIDGYSVYFNGLGSIPLSQEYGTLELRFGAHLFTQGDFNLTGDFIVDASSTFEVIVQDIDLFKKVTCSYFSFVGKLNLIFLGYAPQIGDSFQVIEGEHQFCPSTSPYENFNTDFETILTAQCGADGYGLSVEVLGINYTTSTSWDGEGNDSDWDNPANWDPNGVPTANSRVIINKPGAGGYVRTKGAGVTVVKNIILGANNTLEINGDLLVDKFVSVNKGATFLWQGGKIYSNDSNNQSGITAYGNIILDGPGTKELDTNFYMISYFEDINHNQGDLNINDGYVRMFNYNSYNINGDDISIGYTSGDRHELTISVVSQLKKTAGTGSSSINLTTFINYGDIISESGTLVINGDLQTGEFEEYIDGQLVEYIGSYGGSGNVQFPEGFVLDGEIAPGSSPGILTVVGDLTTSSEATFEIEIDGTIAGTQYDQVLVTENAILEGEVIVTLGYLPANDASFEILTSTAISICNLPETVSASFSGTPYTFTVECFNNSVYLNGPGATLSNSENILDELTIYPNPAINVLNIKSSLISKGNWQLINQLGQVVKASIFEADEINIFVNDLETGLYFFKIEDENLDATVTKRIVISN